MLGGYFDLSPGMFERSRIPCLYNYPTTYYIFPRGKPFNNRHEYCLLASVENRVYLGYFWTFSFLTGGMSRKKNTAQGVSRIHKYFPVVSSFVLLFWHSTQLAVFDLSAFND